MPNRKSRSISLALQGGGAHGAFTWGVLERLVDEPGLAIKATLRALVDADPELAQKLQRMARSIRSPAQTDHLMEELRALGYAK